MAKFSFVILFIFLSFGLLAQNLAQITIDNRGNNDIITFLADGTVAVNLSKDGKIIEWGLEYTIPQTGIYPRLEKYMGKEEYYPSADNEAYAGKVKYIGRTLFTYYTSSDNEALKGKVKTIGITMLDYYREYDNAAYKGNLKSAGGVMFNYYSSFDDQFYKGKIKSIGSTQLSYYGSIDDKALRGKVKNIDRNVFTYYSSYDRKEYAGIMKTGSQMLSSGGLKYIIKNY